MGATNPDTPAVGFNSPNGNSVLPGNSISSQGLGAFIVNAFGLTPTTTSTTAVSGQNAAPGAQPSPTAGGPAPTPGAGTVASSTPTINAPIAPGSDDFFYGLGAKPNGDQISPGQPTNSLFRAPSASTIITNGATLSSPTALGTYPSGGAQTNNIAGAIVPPVFTVGGQIFTPNPTAFAVAETTFSAGGPGVTIGETHVSLDSHSSLIVGDVTTSFPVVGVSSPTSGNGNQAAAPPVLTVGGQVFTPNPTAFAVAGTIVSIDGPGVTIS